MLIHFFRSCLVESDGRVFGYPELVLKLMILIFSDVDLGHSHFALEFSAQQLPLTVKSNASWAVGFVKIDQKSFSGLQEGSLPASAIKEQSVTFLAELLLIVPFFFGSLSLLFLIFLESFQLLGLSTSCVDEVVKMFEDELDDASGGELSRVFDGTVSVISVKVELIFRARDSSHFEESI